MLSEREVRILYESALNTVEKAMDAVTIDVHVVEAELQAKAFALVLEEPYNAPKRPRK
jgi:hypothetical protein